MGNLKLEYGNLRLLLKNEAVKDSIDFGLPTAF